ncbi:MAG: hypothetical protein QM689_12845 [Oscillospiraceae bacterium]
MEINIGDRFGRLEVIEKSSKAREWICRCDCGKTVIKLEKSLRDGVKSCGCLKYESDHKTRKNTIDITGRRYGKLVAVEYSRSASGTCWWKFKCDCGNVCEKRLNTVRTGHTTSCGCVGGREGVKAGRAKNLVDGTNIGRIQSDRPANVNKSGVKGVHFNNREQVWIAKITFQRKSYIWRCKNFADAVAKRKQAEQEIFGKYLDSKSHEKK